MANQTRYFQHLNPQDPNFQKVTELVGVDDTDPTFVLYHFKDGSKCNKEFIGDLNEQNVYGRRELVEVSSPYNIWEFEISNLQRETKYAVNANGERVEIADIMDRCDNPHQDGKRITVKRKPEFVQHNTESASVPKYDFNMATKNTSSLQSEVSMVDSQFDDTEDVDVSKTIYEMSDVITYNYNGKLITTSIKDLVEAANKEPEVKVVEKIVEKKVLADEYEIINIDLDDTQKGLIENMIDMSQKETCDIDMEITLSLPPVSVYNLINTVYPKGMSSAFVNIIANRMNIKELKTKVAQGLLAYYDADAKVDIVVDSSNK